MNRAALAIVCYMLTGCASHVISVRSAWYVIEENGTSVTYISFLNQGNTVIVPEEMILNPVRQCPFSDRIKNGWHVRFVSNQPIMPGKILYLRASDFQQDKKGFEPCMVPLEIDLRIQGRHRLIISKLDIAMPNAVPTGWESACTPAIVRSGSH